MEKMLSGWKGKALPMAGRAVLIRLVAQAIPSYLMQSFLLPKKILNSLDQKVRSFFWNFDDKQVHHYCPKSWDSTCLPKASCGLGLRKMGEMNKALIAKLAWQVYKESDKIWGAID